MSGTIKRSNLERTESRVYFFLLFFSLSQLVKGEALEESKMWRDVRFFGSKRISSVSVVGATRWCEKGLGNEWLVEWGREGDWTGGM